MQESKRGGFRPGAGRPRRPPTLAAAIRAAYSPEKIILMAQTIFDDAEAGAGTRLAALQMLADRAYGKAPDRLELAAVSALDDDEDLSHLSVDQLRALADLDRARDAILDGGSDTGVTDHLLPAGASTEDPSSDADE
jgi:hypothetical protein